MEVAMKKEKLECRKYHILFTPIYFIKEQKP